MAVTIAATVNIFLLTDLFTVVLVIVSSGNSRSEQLGCRC